MRGSARHPTAEALDELERAATLELETRAAEAENGIYSLPTPISVPPATVLALVEATRAASGLVALRSDWASLSAEGPSRVQ